MRAERRAPDATAAMGTRFESLMDQPPSRSAWLETLQQSNKIRHLFGRNLWPRHLLARHRRGHHRVVPQRRHHRRGGVEALGTPEVARRLATLAVDTVAVQTSFVGGHDPAPAA